MVERYTLTSEKRKEKKQEKERGEKEGEGEIMRNREGDKE